jgi:mono/diheme cytochrome c family protein
MLKKALLGLGALIAVMLLGAGGFAIAQGSAFDASMEKVYEIAPLDIHASSDPAVIARGRHLAESMGGCLSCHGDDLGGKPGEPMGPLGVLHGANLTTGKGGVGKRYSDGQLARSIRHGIKSSGKSLRFMPAQDFAWWPDDDLTAIVSYVRSVPPVDRTLGESRIGILGKVLDRLDKLPLDVARRIDHAAARPKTMPAQATAAYGANLAHACTGCHGEHFSGGPIPGAPSDLPIPANITPDPTGIAAYSEADWNKLLDTGIKQNGRQLNPFMPIATLRAMNPTERSALWAYLQSLPAKPFGER